VHVGHDAVVFVYLKCVVVLHTSWEGDWGLDGCSTSISSSSRGEKGFAGVGGGDLAVGKGFFFSTNFFVYIKEGLLK